MGVSDRSGVIGRAFARRKDETELPILYHPCVCGVLLLVFLELTNPRQFWNAGKVL